MVCTHGDDDLDRGLLLAVVDLSFCIAVAALIGTGLAARPRPLGAHKGQEACRAASCSLRWCYLLWLLPTYCMSL